MHACPFHKYTNNHLINKHPLVLLYQHSSAQPQHFGFMQTKFTNSAAVIQLAGVETLSGEQTD